MPLSQELIRYKSNSDSKFTETFIAFLDSKNLSVSDYLVIVKFAYEYEEHIKSNLDYFKSNLSKLEATHKEHQLLWAILQAMYNQTYPKDQVRKGFGNYVFNNFPKLDIFKDYKTLSYYENTRFRKDPIYFITKWFGLFSKGYENLYCEVCDSLLVPTFKVVDNYICCNPSCTDKNVHYENHCWHCGSEINSKFHKKCASCGWYICSECNSCLQDHPKGCPEQKPEESHTVVELINFKIPYDQDSLFRRILHTNNQLFKKGKNKNIRYECGIQLNRGTKILTSQDELIYYWVSYGEMHYVKLLSNFSKVNFNEINNVSIFDWGCGQGIGSLAFLDYCKQNKFNVNVCDVHLIEPSEKALDMAQNYLSNSMFNKDYTFKLNCINKKLEEISEIPSGNNGNTNIHLFSNILDVSSFDINKFSETFTELIKGDNLIFCISPKYKKSEERINIFFNHVRRKVNNTQLLAADSKYLKSEIIGPLGIGRSVKRSISNYSMIFKVFKN